MVVDREPQVITTKHTSAASHLYEVHLRTNDGEGAASVTRELKENGAYDVSTRAHGQLSRVRWHGPLAALVQSDDTGMVVALASCDCHGGEAGVAALMQALTCADWASARRWAGAESATSVKVKLSCEPAMLQRLGITAKQLCKLAVDKVVAASPGWQPADRSPQAMVVLELSCYDADDSSDTASAHDTSGTITSPWTHSAGVAVLIAGAGEHGRGSGVRSRDSTLHRASIVLERRGAVPPSWLRACRQEKVLQYAADRFGLPRLVADLLGVPTADDLPRLHLLCVDDCRWPLHPKLARAFQAAGRRVPSAAMPTHFGDQKGGEDDARHRAFLHAFRRFVHQVVIPCCGGTARRVLCQVPPTLRVALPGAPATISLHSDARYPKHMPEEVNWWLPLTPCFGSNTLWAESSPGAADFRPMTLGSGECLVFHGYACRHYTLTNTTETSRVSFDWRVVPAELLSASQRESVERIGDYTVGDYTVERIGGEATRLS